MIVDNEVDLVSKLKSVFGYNQFRGYQEDIINHLLEGRNVFVIMPTGAGKSMCYQLPALMTQGTAIVISPLIALMKNQVDQLNALGINAQFLNSTLSKAEITKVKNEVISGDLKLLYVAPESLTKQENIDFLRKAQISFVAIDEAHCISEWGHDFRPEYRKIRSIIDELGKLPVIALTATATPKVQQDILKNLDMDQAITYKSSFNRENLYYEVRPKVNAKKQLVQFIKSQKGKSGIIYCLSRKKVEEIAEFLRVNDIKARPYHAGMEPSVRIKNQDAFLNEDVDVIVATIAFGMGIDKPDVRFVIHYDAPKSLEGYYQETGRSGRDGLEGNCIMFYSYKDIIKLEKFNKDKTVTERDNAKHLLEEVAAYAEASVCRRKYLLHYFGEGYETENCGYCDNCIKPKETYDARDLVILALKSVAETGARFDMPHLTNVLRGSKSEYVTSYGHHELSVYGKGKDASAEEWLSIFRQTLLQELLAKDIDNYGVIKLTDKGREFLEAPYPIRFSNNHNFPKEITELEDEPVSAGKGYDPVLYDALKKLRKSIAKEKNLPPYVIFQDPSLEEMSTTYPLTRDDLSHINGVGMGKAAKFGKPFLEFIKKYVEENDIATANDVVVKSSGTKSKVKIFIIQQIDRKVDLEEIADSKNMKMEELIEEIEHICYSGTKLNLDYYIDLLLDDEKQQDVYDYFMNVEDDNIALAMEELGPEDFTEEEVRLMRIKFLSELAN